MTELTVDLNEYLSEDEKRQIAREAFREVAASVAHKDFERIMSNASYQVAFQEADRVLAELGEEGRQIIAAKVKDCLKELGAFQVFRQADAWQRSESPAFSMMCEAVRDNKPLIEQRVSEALRGISYDDLRDRVDELIVSVLESRLSINGD